MTYTATDTADLNSDGYSVILERFEFILSELEIKVVLGVRNGVSWRVNIRSLREKRGAAAPRRWDSPVE